jgi:hypothetical protein
MDYKVYGAASQGPQLVTRGEKLKLELLVNFTMATSESLSWLSRLRVSITVICKNEEPSP